MKPIWCCSLFFTIATADLSFLLLGDWGKGGYNGKSQLFHSSNVHMEEKTSYQLSIAKAMSNFASSAESKPSFVVALGDNFYDDGVSSSTDTLWLSLWKYVYLLDYPDLYIPWYPVLGNHDWNGSPRAQLQRYHDHLDDDIWMAESTNFTKSFTIPGTSEYITIVFLDTTTLAPSETKATSQLSSSMKESLIKDQLQHLNIYLSAATSASKPPCWLFVAGHYPVFSRGEHGDIAELTSYLLPLLEQYSVDAYFSGHDHISEHLSLNGIDYFVAGAGSMADSLNSKGSSAASLLWSGTGYAAFAVVNADSDSYTVKFIDNNNEVKYEATRYRSSAAVSASVSPSVGPTKAPSSPTDVIIDTPPSVSQTTAEKLVTSYQSMPAVVLGGSAVGLLLILLAGYVIYRKNNRDKSNSDGSGDSTSRRKRKGRMKMVVPSAIYSTKALSKRRLLSLGLQAIQYEEVDQAALNATTVAVSSPSATARRQQKQYDTEVGLTRSKGDGSGMFAKGHSTYMPTDNNKGGAGGGQHKRAVSMPV